METALSAACKNGNTVLVSQVTLTKYYFDVFTPMLFCSVLIQVRRIIAEKGLAAVEFPSLVLHIVVKVQLRYKTS